MIEVVTVYDTETRHWNASAVTNRPVELFYNRKLGKYTAERNYPEVKVRETETFDPKNSCRVLDINTGSCYACVRGDSGNFLRIFPRSIGKAELLNKGETFVEVTATTVLMHDRDRNIVVGTITAEGKTYNYRTKLLEGIGEFIRNDCGIPITAEALCAASNL